MKIQFSKNDPRRGMVVEMDEYRARELIAAGSAVEVKAEVVAHNKAIPAAPENKAVNKAKAK